uniref:Uncharacterized protein n=1 Tax=Anguilla anguilla TaxID=7936 RepID=A0A0E9QLZ7_ANGAN
MSRETSPTFFQLSCFVICFGF